MKDCKDLESGSRGVSSCIPNEGMHDIEAGDNMMHNVPLAAVSHNFNEVLKVQPR